MANRKFKIVLIKPGHYDADGYVIQWRRSTMPSNSLASLYALLAECAEERVLGPDVDIEIDACDECNTVVNVKKAVREIRRAGAGFVGLIGVQSNQYPRALDLARQFRAADLPVVIGGFHVSGCISMLPELPADLQDALDMGVTLYAGEGEGRMAEPCARHRGRNAETALQFPLRSSGARGSHHPVPAEPRDQAHRRALHQLRCRARLPVPVLILHHHQRAGPQVALSLRRRHREDRALEHRAGHFALLRHRRQFRAQPQLGTDFRSAHSIARGRPANQAVPAGRHALSSHSELHREGGARRLYLGVHRAREHQPRIPDGREEAPEQDLGVSRDAPAVAQAKGDHLRGLHPGFPDRHPGDGRARYRDHQEGTPD